MGAFGENQLASVIIPPSVTSIGEVAFCHNQLTDLIIPPSVTTIGNRAFDENYLESVIVPANVELLDNSQDLCDYYNTNGKRAGVYTYGWSYRAQ